MYIKRHPKKEKKHKEEMTKRRLQREDIEK